MESRAEACGTRLHYPYVAVERLRDARIVALGRDRPTPLASPWSWEVSLSRFFVILVLCNGLPLF